MRVWVGALVLSVALAACGGGSPSATPVQPSGPPASPAGGTLQGLVVGALDDAGRPGLTVRVASGPSAVSDRSGHFALSGVSLGFQATTVSGQSVVTRQTGMTAPATDVKVQVIPADFDLAAFDQMLRQNGYLRRWVEAPSLIIVSRVLRFTTADDNEFVAQDEELSDGEIEGLSGDLAGGFMELTAGALGAFAAVLTERPTPGQSVLVSRQGFIVVARQEGLTAATNALGRARWATAGTEVVGGSVFLDRDFEKSGNWSRRAVRVHELGHALGYRHVTRRLSVMNTPVNTLPTDWDRQAVRIAFQRPPGNRPPDADPAWFSVNQQLGTRSPVTWGPWIR